MVSHHALQVLSQHVLQELSREGVISQHALQQVPREVGACSGGGAWWGP